MDDVARQALEESIRTWEHRVTSPSRATRQSCGLCTAFWRETGYGCDPRCPIKAKTGRNYCLGNEAYEKYVKGWHEDWPAEDLREVAREEVEFLKSLREE